MKLVSVLENRLSELSEETILHLRSHGQFNNVIIGIERECFSLFGDDSKNEVKYQLVYVNGEKRLRGYVLEFSIKLKSRNELLFLFCKFLKQEFTHLNLFEVFNTYQQMVRTMFEQIGIFTYTDEDFEKIIGKNPHVILKGYKSYAYLPFIEKSKFDSKKYTTNEVVQPTLEIANVSDDTFIYLMLNRANGRYKIGRSKYPFVREKTLQSQEPDIEMIEKWKSKAKIEKKLHLHFKHKRIRGEWFDLDEIDIEFIKDYFQNHDNQ